MWLTAPLETVVLVTFTEEIPNRKLYFMCSVRKLNEHKISEKLAVFSETATGGVL